MADKTVSQLPNAEGVNITDLFLLSQGTSTLGFDSKKLAASVLAVWLANSMEFPQQLDTDSKTLIGAINELFAGGGGGGGRLDIEYDSVEEIFNVTSDEITEALEKGYMITFSSDETADDFLYILNSVHTDNDELNLFFSRFWCMGNGSSNPNNGDLFQCIVTVDTTNDTVTFGGYSEVANILSTIDNLTGQYNNWSALKIDTAIKQAIYKVLPTRSASGTIASFTDGAENMPIVDGVFNIEAIQSGSGDPSPSNERPILGFTGMTIAKRGINLWDEVWEVGGIDSSTGQDVPADDRIRSKNYIPVKGGLSYYCKTNAKTMGLRFYDYSKNYINYTTVIDGVVAIPSDVYFIRFIYLNTTTYENDISINYPSTDTAYHSYTGTTFSVDWTDEAGTVYGGTFDSVTGVLTVTWASVVLDENSGTWQFQAAFQQGYISDVLQAAPAKYENRTVSHLCDKLKPVSNYRRGDNLGNFSSLINSGSGVGLSCTAESLEDFITWITNNPVTFVYELATPVEIALTPEQINTLLGSNNIWCDTGNSTVKYKADIGLLISGLEA